MGVYRVVNSKTGRAYASKGTSLAKAQAQKRILQAREKIRKSNAKSYVSKGISKITRILKRI